MQPLKMEFTSSSALELLPAEQSLYGTMDRVRQMMNAGIRRFVAAHRELLVGRVLDYGAGKPGTCRIPQPFRELVSHAAEYCPWDLGDAEPVGPFGAILCTQAAQNFEDPLVTFASFRNLLTPGGHLVLTWPIAWEPIEQEYWRFTPKGIWLLCHKAGLRIITNEILALEMRDPGGAQPLAGGVVAVRT